ncbi:MAG: glycosyltransferase [Sphingomonadales bacterium]|nr:glycosyltransferase [Sphingomonadales bacterium]
MASRGTGEDNDAIAQGPRGQGDSAEGFGEHIISDIERYLCGPAAQGRIDGLQTRHPDAWHLRLPGLDSLLDGDTAQPEAAQSEPGQTDAGQPLRICIATEQITGPVRNGGIGSTYANLALMLAEQGFDVTVLYLRGEQVETETIGHWVDHYAKKGVRLVPAPDYASTERFVSNSDRWLRVPYNMMRWLIDNPMDVVHVSEWRGTGYLCLLAKRQGWAFAQTLFVVKTSSPWMWNRLYGGHMLDRADDLVKTYAERRSVELGDIVVGGSLHLLRWMASQGYALPEGRSFVQPNVATFTSLEPLMRARTLTPGTRTPIDELVFFGRLEVRKGLFIFCQAIRRLVRKGVPLPRRITFMGKPGGRLPSHPELDTPDYIREVSDGWPCEVQILSGFQQYEAIEYLLGGKRLAIMPSVIENSSMAVYEAAICAIPTLATDVGGNAELIDPRDHAAVLCLPHPVSLADKLEEVLTLGGMVPRPSFSNDANLEIWSTFHRQLKGPLHQQLLDRARGQQAPAPDQPATAVCIYFLGHAAALEATLASLAAQTVPPREVLVGVDGDSDEDCGVAAAALARHGFEPRAVECFDLDAGATFNRLAEAATSDFALFVWEGATLVQGALGELERIARRTDAQVMNFLVEVRELGADGPPDLKAPFIVGVSDAFFRDDETENPLFVRRDTFLKLDGFTTDYRLLGHDHEFVARAQLAGYACETVPMRLGSTVAQPAEWLRARGYDLSATGFRVLRPMLAAAPLAMRDTLLLARGMAARGGSKGKLAAVANPEGVLMRIMAGLKPDRSQPAPAALSVPAVASAKPAARTRQGKPRANGVGTGGLGNYIALLNMVAGEDLAMPVARPRAPRARTLSPLLKTLVARGDVAREGEVVGQLLGVHHNRIHGWVGQLRKDAPPLGVEVVIDGIVLRAVADSPFVPFADVPDEARRAGFVIDLPAQKTRRKAGLAFRIAVTGSEIVLNDGLIMPRSVTFGSMGYDGMVEVDSSGAISGSVRHRHDRARRCNLALFADGTFFARVSIDGSGDGRFTVPVPDIVRNGGAHEIAVVLADSGVILPGGLLTVMEGQIVRQRSTIMSMFGR